MSVQELLIGIEGLALLRGLHEADAEPARRLAEIRELLDDDAASTGHSLREADPRTGYAAWAATYDEPGNPVIALEESAVWSAIEAFPPGQALDAACGTGRHARHLLSLGHDVTGIDLTQEMLQRASTNAPEARFLEADLREIPAADEAFDLVVCGLALAHLEDMRDGVAELGRVLKPGGQLVISVLHPFQVHLGWHTAFEDAEGQRGFVREHGHTHADYLAVFRAARLEVAGCAEPRLDDTQLPAKRRAFDRIPEATRQAYAGLPGVLVWDVRKP